MEEEKKVYPQIEELLPEGSHIVKVYPQNLWDKEAGAYKEGTIMSGEYKTGGGHWYIYKTKIGEEYVSMFANDENKAGFDQGWIKVNIVPKRVKGSKEDIYDATGKKLLKAFYNQLTPVELSMKLNQGASLEDVNAMAEPSTAPATSETVPMPTPPQEEEIDIEKLPF